MAKFCDMLRYLRKREGLTQFQLAEKTGISRSRINNYETGIREPDFDTLGTFAEFFNVTTDELLGKTDDKPQVLPDEVCDLLAVVGKLTAEDRAIIRIIADKYK